MFAIEANFTNGKERIVVKREAAEGTRRVRVDKTFSKDEGEG